MLVDSEHVNMATLSEPNRSTKVIPWPRAFRRLAPILLVLAGLTTFGWFEREPLLRGAAELWIVSDTLTRADAVAVFGGGAEVRPFVAADLYRRGLVNKILVSRVVEEQTVAIGAALTHMDLNRTVLVK